MIQLKKDDVLVPYKETDLSEIDDFEFIKSFIEDLSNSSLTERRIKDYNQRPPTNFDRSTFNSSMYRVLQEKLGNTGQGSFQTINMKSNLRENLESYLEKDLSAYYYLDDYSNFINIDSLPVVTEINKEQKILQFQIELLNQIFKPFNKNLLGDTYFVKIPDVFVSNYEYFINNKLFLQDFEKNEKLFHIINSYFRNIIYNKTHNFTLSETFKYTGLSEQVYFNEKKNLLSIKLDNSVSSYRYNNKNTNHYHYQFWLFTSKMINLLTTIEMIGLLKEDSVALNLDSKKEVFLEKIKNRRIPISEISHKSASKKADKLGLTHLFLPLDEEAIPAGLPFSLKAELNAHGKIMNIWNIIPPTNGFSVVREYIGHNNNYPEYTTLAEPHLVGLELMKVRFDDNFYDYLIKEYDWEYKEEAIKTLQLVKEFPRLSNDLGKLAKEHSLND